MGGLETTRKTVLSGQDRKNTPETPMSSKCTKTLDGAFTWLYIYIYICIYAQESVFWPPLAFFVVSNLSAFFGFISCIHVSKPDTSPEEQQKTSRDNFLIGSILSTLSSVICPPKIQILAQKMWTKYWQSRGQITDYQILVFSFKNDLTKLSKKNTIKIGISMEH